MPAFLQSTMYCVCGCGDRQFETCNTPGCYNIICVADCNSPCLLGIPEGAWICAMHGGNGHIVYNANVEVDVWVLPFCGSSFGGSIFTNAVKLAFHGYRQGQVKLCEQPFYDISSL